MGISEILQQMASTGGESGVLLVREGLFWRAYEHGALALCECVHPFKVTTRYYKGIDQWLSYVGFPDTSLERWSEGRQVDKFDDKKLLLHLTAEEQKHVADVFTEWKQQQVATAKAQAAEGEAQNGGVRKIGKMVSREKQVLMRLQAFPLERSSPLECMTFLSELKNMLQTDAADFPQTNETAYGSE